MRWEGRMGRGGMVKKGIIGLIGKKQTHRPVVLDTWSAWYCALRMRRALHSLYSSQSVLKKLWHLRALVDWGVYIFISVLLIYSSCSPRTWNMKLEPRHDIQLDSRE